jgi:hypothetical protein
MIKCFVDDELGRILWEVDVVYFYVDRETSMRGRSSHNTTIFVFYLIYQLHVSAIVNSAIIRLDTIFRETIQYNVIQYNLQYHIVLYGFSENCIQLDDGRINNGRNM